MTSLAGGIVAGGVDTLHAWNGDRQPVMPLMSVIFGARFDGKNTENAEK